MNVLREIALRHLITRWGVGHAEVSADHIDDSLSLIRVILRQQLQ
jgi:hypothetical protein